MKGRPPGRVTYALTLSHAEVRGILCPKCQAMGGQPCRLVLEGLRTAQELEWHHPERLTAARVAANRAHRKSSTAAMRAAEALWRR